MIAEKLRIIKQKSTEPSPILTTSTTQAQQSQAQPQPQQPQGQANEINQITARLNQVRPQIPQIDKLLHLHSKLTTTPPAGTLEMAKKLTDCRNILVNQIEISSSTTTKKSFLMNLSQLNLLIEQVQRLFNSLVSKMKESAGIQNSNVNGNNSSHSQNKAPTTSQTASGSNLYYAKSSTSLSSTSSASSVKSQTSSQKKLTTSPSTTSSYDKLLLQRLSLPPDRKSANIQAQGDNWVKKYVLHGYSNGNTFETKLSHLKWRNRLLLHELKLLKLSSSSLKIHVQEIGLGTLNILISCQNYRFTFKISAKYPYDQLIYRVEHESNCGRPLKEPKTFPFTITTILRNHLSE